jgi:hypothetical protein
MSQIERIRRLLEGKGIIPDVKEDGRELVTMISTGVVTSRLIIGERDGVLACSVLIPVFCPEYRRSEMAVAVSKANWGLFGGSFRLDTKDGEIRYECFLPVLDGEITERQLTWLIHGSWTVTGRYAMALTEVAVSAASPEDAINRAEASWQEESRALPVV